MSYRDSWTQDDRDDLLEELARERDRAATANARDIKKIAQGVAIAPALVVAVIAACLAMKACVMWEPECHSSVAKEGDSISCYPPTKLTVTHNRFACLCPGVEVP